MIALTILSMLCMAFQNDAQNKSLSGKELFQRNCAVCHSTSDKTITGPGLAGVTQKRSMPWLVRWVRNSNELINSGDADAIRIYEKYKRKPQPIYMNFSDDDIRSIFAYIDAVNKK